MCLEAFICPWLNPRSLNVTAKFSTFKSKISIPFLNLLSCLSIAWLIAWEQGKAKPSAKNIYKLAKIYAVEPTVIFNTIFKQKT